MTKRQILWAIPALLYALFAYWYTDFGGPLTDAEIDQYVATMKSNGSAPEDIALIEEFARSDSGSDFLMVNNIDFNEQPPEVEGATPGEDAQQLMARYMEYMFPALLARACHPAMMGDVVYRSIDIVGIENAEQWDQAALFRYRSRRDLLDIVTNPEFSGRHHFKAAALDKTIAYPVETAFYPGDPRLLLGLLLLALTALLDAFWLGRKRA